MFVCPVIGLIGLIFGIKEKDKLFMALNVLLILLVPIAMFAGHLVDLFKGYNKFRIKICK